MAASVRQACATPVSRAGSMVAPRRVITVLLFGAAAPAAAFQPARVSSQHRHSVAVHSTIDNRRRSRSDNEDEGRRLGGASENWRAGGCLRCGVGGVSADERLRGLRAFSSRRAFATNLLSRSDSSQSSSDG